MARKMRVFGAAMVRAGRGFVHGGPGPALLAPAWVCPGLGVEALNTGVEASSSGVEALGSGDEALNSGADALISDVGALISEREALCAPASRL